MIEWALCEPWAACTRRVAEAQLVAELVQQDGARALLVEATDRNPAPPERRGAVDHEGLALRARVDHDRAVVRPAAHAAEAADQLLGVVPAESGKRLRVSACMRTRMAPRMHTGGM